MYKPLTSFGISKSCDKQIGKSKILLPIFVETCSEVASIMFPISKVSSFSGAGSSEQILEYLSLGFATTTTL